MSLKIKTLLSNSSNYGGSRNTSLIQYIVYHYTANKTDKAKSNASYFKNNIVKASAHYFVDAAEVWQSVPDNKIAFSVGGGKYPSCSTAGGGKMYGKITNTNSISIEMCSTNGQISDKTISNAVKLGQKLMKKYHIPSSNIYRHFDVNGKPCPGWAGWIGSDCSKWNSLRKKLKAADDSVSSSPNSQTGSNIYQVKLLDNLNIRKTPNGEIVRPDGARKGTVYTITETSGSWGKLKSGAGWINVSDKYAVKIQEVI